MSGSGVFRIGVLLSGRGTSFQNLLDHIAVGRLPGVQVAVAIYSDEDVPGVDVARLAGVPSVIVRPRDYDPVIVFSAAVAAALDRYRVDLAVQAGWMPYWRPPRRWLGRVINIHPSLLPKYGGKGFYGQHVHEAVLLAGERESGATVHWVDEEYDHGPIIEQRRCPVLREDTLESLRDRVQAVEWELLPAVIERIACGAVSQAL